MKMEAPHQMRQRHPETSMRKDASVVMAATETVPSIDSVKPQERFAITSRGVFLLVMAFVTFEAFAVCVLLELSRLNPSAAAWLPINASSLREMDETLHSACMWILLAAIPITSVAAWTPTSIIAQISPATPAPTTGIMSPSISPKTAALKKQPLVPHRDPYFRIFQLVAWTLYAAFLGGWALCPNARWSFCAIDYRTTMAVLAFLAEVLIVSSILALDRVHFVRSPRKERLVVMINNFNNMLLVVGAVLLAVSAELVRNTHDEGTHEDAKVLGQYSLSSGVNSVALVVTAVFNTYGLAGVLAPKAGWRFYQPFTGGAKFMLFQAISWTCFAAGIFIQGLYLLSIVIVELELFVGAMALAGSLFLISEVVMVMSLLVFKSKGSSEDGRAAVRSLPPFQQRLRDFTQECLGAFLVGLMANIQWIPSALFFVLYATTTSLRASQVVVYSLATSLVEVLIVISKSIATHMYNKDSQYGKLTHISENGAKYLFPQVLTMLLPAYLTHYHYVNDHAALFPVAMLSGFSYMYVFTYGGQPQVTGSRKRQSWIMERSEIMETVSSYFSGKILREAPLDPNQHYVMGFHPHGIMSTSVLWLQFSEQWRELFPGFYANILTASVLHQIPLARDVLQFFGGREVTRQSFSRALEHKESVMLVPGGQAEMLEQRSGVKQVRVYTHHKGFIRLAIEHGTPLVPVLSFKEGETLDNVRAPQLQRWFIKKLAFPFPYYPYGRFGLPIPRKKDITIAVGAPIEVERKENPTPADVDAVHEVYFGKIKELFEKHKDEAGCADYSLVLI